MSAGVKELKVGRCATLIPHQGEDFKEYAHLRHSECNEESDSLRFFTPLRSVQNDTLFQLLHKPCYLL